MTQRLRFRVGKLIRDRLPQIMRDAGLEVFERRLDDSGYAAALKAKLVEEAAEAEGAASRAELVEELADVAEVVAALAAVHGIDASEIEAARLRKRDVRGGFDDRVFNAAVAADAGAPALDYYLARPSQYPPMEDGEGERP